MTESFTDYFRDEYFPRFLNLKENDLKAFVLEHYLVLSEKNEGRAATMVSAEENTAYDNMELIMENLHDIYSGSITASQLMAPGKFADAEEKKAARQEMREAENVFFCWELPVLLHEKYPHDEDFLRVIDHLDRRLSHPAKYLSSGDRRITRSAFLSMCLSDYITTLGDVENLDSFPELYRDFTDTVNPQLEAARFQPFQEKNLMDLYVLLSLYFYVVKNGV